MHIKIVMTVICERAPRETDEDFAAHYAEFRSLLERSITAGSAIKVPADHTTLRWLIAGRSIASLAT